MIVFCTVKAGKKSSYKITKLIGVWSSGQHITNYIFLSFFIYQQLAYGSAFFSVFSVSFRCKSLRQKKNRKWSFYLLLCVCDINANSCLKWKTTMNLLNKMNNPIGSYLSQIKTKELIKSNDKFDLMWRFMATYWDNT